MSTSVISTKTDETYEVPGVDNGDATAAIANNTDYENTEDGYFNLVKPQKIFLFMLNKIPVVFNYSIPCDYAEEQLLVSFRSLNKDVFEIDGNTSVIVECDESATLKTIGENASMALVSLETLSTTFAAEGSLVVLIYGKLIGLSSDFFCNTTIQ